jgi:hypothetical protein
MLLAVPPGEMTPLVVQAAESPVRLDHVRILTTADAPPVLLYAAISQTSDQLEQFTVIAFVFDVQGRLKARQVAPARRALDPRSTKFSAMVLDGSPIEPTDVVVVGVNQAQRADTETWWRADLQAAAEEAVKKRKP